jgi:hypothetical protein
MAVRAGFAQEGKPASAAPAKSAEAKPAEPAPEAKAAAKAAPPADTKPVPPAAPAGPAAKVPARPPRRLAPGVMITIPPATEALETVTRQDVVELLAVDEKFQWAKDVAFRRDIFGLEFRFKPVRMVYVDLPQPSGLMQRKLIWYLVYNVTNPGKTLHPSKANDGTFEVQEVDQPVRFVPEFVLEATKLDKRYPDRVIPLALRQIAQREDPNQTFHSTVEMVRDLQPGETAWGIATWEEVDPRTDQFAIYVYGLTNAYRWTNTAKLQPNDHLGKGRVLYRKALQLNFWRPGDEFDRRPTELEAEVRFGLPGKPDYQWVFLPLGS